MILSDRDITKGLKNKEIIITSPYKIALQPSSIDVHLSPHILIFSRHAAPSPVIDLKKPVDDYMHRVKVDAEKGAIIYPQEFILGVTDEWLSLSNNLIANVEGKSSLGRLGLIIHATAGFIDPGWKGHITLEIANLTNLPIIIYPHMPIGQIRFSQLSSPSEHSYGEKALGSKYKNIYSKSPKPMASQYWKNLV